MQDAVNVSLTINREPHGLLLLAVVENAVQTINAWFRRRRLKRALTEPEINVMLEAAQNADDWLRGCIDSRLTFDDVCHWHGFDREQFRDQIYRQWDFVALKLMRRRRVLRVRKGRPVHGSQD